ncbi:MAG: hypothetical protein ACFNUO_10415, partial [Capnocytophaga ochracea]
YEHHSTQPLHTEEQLLVKEWCKEKQISFDRSEIYFTKGQLASTERGIEQANNGLLRPYTEVKKRAREISLKN